MVSRDPGASCQQAVFSWQLPSWLTDVCLSHCGAAAFRVTGNRTNCPLSVSSRSGRNPTQRATSLNPLCLGFRFLPVGFVGGEVAEIMTALSLCKNQRFLPSCICSPGVLSSCKNSDSWSLMCVWDIGTNASDVSSWLSHIVTLFLWEYCTQILLPACVPFLWKSLTLPALTAAFFPRSVSTLEATGPEWSLE